MEPFLVNGQRTDKNRTEAEYRAEREKREADRVATANTLALGGFMRGLTDDILGGVK